MVHLHCRSWFSFLAGGSSPEALVQRAHQLGHGAIALTDLHGVYGAVRFAAACRAVGIKPLFGTTLMVGEDRAVPVFDPRARPDALGRNAGEDRAVPVFDPRARPDALDRNAGEDRAVPVFDPRARPDALGRNAGKDAAPPYPLVLIAQNEQGYDHLCTLISAAHLNAHPSPLEAPDEDLPEPPTSGAYAPLLYWRQLVASPRDHLVCLTAGPEGRLGVLLRESKTSAAEQWLERLRRLFPDRLYVELVHRMRPGDGPLLRQMARLAARHGLPVVASNAVRHATPEDLPRYDALTCIRLGITVGDRHPERPVNDHAWLIDDDTMRKLIPFPDAFDNTHRIAAACDLDLLPGEVTPPTALLPPGTDAGTHLRKLCLQGLRERYGNAAPPPRGALSKAGASTPRQRDGAPIPAYADALAQLEHELEVVTSLDLSEFFLVVHEVTHFAKSRSIRYAGRGSAANSIIAYCLGITTVDPLRHKLLFERFLHRGRKGMPDIDVDFDSERRIEVIEWMERRFGAAHTAMTANVNTYRVKMATREMMKVLGWDLDIIGRVGKILSHHDAMSTLHERRAEFVQILGMDTPLLDVLFTLVAGLRGCPRHLSLHNGGMILSRTPLARHTPVQISANGVRQVQFDKEDVEALGLIKFDVLGLRSLAVVSEALTLHEADTHQRIDLDAVPMDDPRTYQLIRSGQTMSVFQIESPGQWNLLSRTQPRDFDDLVAEVALFRPGPLQGGMVNPYVERRAGREEVTYLHPSLEPILKDTFGIILYQEQVLEVSHQFAGMSLEEADRFRALMSKWRDPGDMEGMRVRFVQGAVATHGVSPELADRIFAQVAAFVGYGFCRSHAAAFARIVFHTAWLKAHHPAAYMAAVLQHKPGFYPMSTVVEEIKHLGVRILPVDVWRSGPRYSLEGGAIRIPLTQVKGVSEAMAQAMTEQRKGCRTLESLRRAVSLPRDVWDSLARAGAFEQGGDARGRGQGITRRDALWQLGLLRDVPPPTHQPDLVEADNTDLTLFPDLPALDEAHAVAWDFATMDLSPRTHPVALHRRLLDSKGVKHCTEVYRIPPGTMVQVAGIVVVLQRPPTAKGMLFLVLEDETGRLPVAVAPHLYERLKKTLRSATLLVEGRVEQAGASYRSLMTRRAWPLTEVVRGGRLEDRPTC